MGVNCLIFAGVSNFHGKQITSGPIRIATQLRENGFTVQVVDLSEIKDFNKIYQLFLKKFVDKDTLWVGFSVNFLENLLDYQFKNTLSEIQYLQKTNPQYGEHLNKFFEYTKSLNPSIQFVVGGIRLFSLDKVNVFQFRGHTDQQIVEFTQQLSKGIVPSQKVFYNKEYKSFSTSRVKYLKQDVLDYHKSLAVEISRGCIFNCRFCAFPLNGKTKGDWIKDFDILREEFIFNYEQYGVTHYNFSDDTYNDTPSKIEGLYNNVFSKLPFKLTFSAYLRLDLIHRFPHTAEILKHSGIKSVVFGIETLNKTAGKIIGKGLDPNTQIEFLIRLKQNEFKEVLCGSGWIVGLPSDNKKTCLDFAKWVASKNNPLDENYINSLSIYPDDLFQFRLYRSQFDVNWKNYNIDFYQGKEGKYYWKYKDNDLTQEWCDQLSNNLNYVLAETSNNKLAGFYYGALLNLGYSHNHIMNTKRRDYTNLKEMGKQSLLKYYKNLYSV